MIREYSTLLNLFSLYQLLIFTAIMDNQINDNNKFHQMIILNDLFYFSSMPLASRWYYGNRKQLKHLDKKKIYVIHL